MATNSSFAYTARFPIYRDRIASMVYFSASRAGALPVPFRCMWDTGTSLTLVSTRVADALGLEVSDETVTLRSALGGVSTAQKRVAYLHIVLGAIPLRLKVGVVSSPCSDSDIDVMIGMDLISQGSFAISYDGGQLMFSFCYPPAPMPLDFTEMLPMLGLNPAVAVVDAADNDDPAASRAAVNFAQLLTRHAHNPGEE